MRMKAKFSALFPRLFLLGFPFLVLFLAYVLRARIGDEGVKGMTVVAIAMMFFWRPSKLPRMG